ncbi:hypothetical protein [Paraburkholderia sp. MM5477-R1]|uniref:hypothetical protein n=1 Tax=Paraburkholderia sp. MM5477-R1 TaxID=2991062 RepID=UPI003D24F0B7
MNVTDPHVLGTEFERFAKSNIPPGASLAQHSDVQRAFFAGVLVLFGIHDVLAEMPEQQAVEALDRIREEAFAFAVTQLVINGRLSERGPLP